MFKGHLNPPCSRVGHILCLWPRGPRWVAWVTQLYVVVVWKTFSLSNTFHNLSFGDEEYDFKYFFTAIWTETVLLEWKSICMSSGDNKSSCWQIHLPLIVLCFCLISDLWKRKPSLDQKKKCLARNNEDVI